MFDVQVETESAGDTLEALATIEGMKTGLAAGALYLKSAIAVYPPERHAQQPFTSDAQRRGFFAKLHSGSIVVPYVRGMSGVSEGLGRRWTTEASADGLTHWVGNNASYGPLVQSEEQQTAYHRATGWITDAQVMENEDDQVFEIVQAEVDAWLRGV